MKNFLFWLAVCGWLASVTVHVLSLNDVDVETTVPYVWGLHIGIFAVWIPTILKLKNNKELQELRKSGRKELNPLKGLNMLMPDTPAWMRVIVFAGFIYAFVNFFISFAGDGGGTASIVNGKYVLESHGTFIKDLTLQEYNHYKASSVRGFSGHWMLFYGMAAAILYPFKKEEDIDVYKASRFN